MKQVLVGNAHLVAGGAAALPALLERLSAAGIEAQGNPDVYLREYRGFGIDEARELRERATLGAVRGRSRVFIIVTPAMTTDAQNALLKTVEEPPAGSRFFFLIPAPQTLLPTLRSRAQILILDDEAGLPDVASFVSAPPQKRLDLLKPLLEKGEDDKRDLGAVLSFLAALERALAKDPEGLRAVYRTRKYVTDKGALTKPLLEQLALLVP